MSTVAHPVLLEGKTIVVIGGTTGLGFSAAKAFVQNGANVIALGRDHNSVEAAREQLGKQAYALVGDATFPNSAGAAIAEAVSRFGRIDGLYHVAGGSGRKFGDGPLHEITDDGWRKTIDLNLTSVFYSNRAAVRQFLKQKSGGSILNVSSVLAWSPSAELFSTHTYAAAKAAIIGLTQSCAAKYASDKIRFNVIAPGLIATPMSQRAQGDEQILSFIKSKQPLDGGRMGQASDLDGAAVYFMSDSSRFVTGQVLAVDGGWSLTDGQIPHDAVRGAAVSHGPAAAGEKRQSTS